MALICCAGGVWKPTQPLARLYVDRAAGAGMKDAVALRDAGYDYTVVTPDADEWKYLKPAF